MFSSGDDSTSFNQGNYNTQANPGVGHSEFSEATATHNTGYYNPNEHSNKTGAQQQQAYGNAQLP